MIYSVWNQGARQWDYYEDNSQQSTANTPKPSHIPNARIGATPDEAAWPLPSSARRTGSGNEPRGRVAARKGALSGVGNILDEKLVVTAGVLGLLWWVTR